MNIITSEHFLKNNTSRSTTTANDVELDQVVLEIISQVKKYGDEALFRYTETFDSVKLDNLIVSEQEFKEAENLVEPEFIQAFKQAKSNITAFHKGQLEKSWFMNQQDGITVGQKIAPLERVGIYVPGGKASYPSTVLMNTIPAKLAGVDNIAITTPPQTDGKINPHVLVAAQESGVDIVYKVGGAQAIAALAYGTETIEKVVKIVGPGNAFVAREIGRAHV